MIETIVQGYKHNTHSDPNYVPKNRSFSQMAGNSIGSGIYLFFEPLIQKYQTRKARTAKK